MNRLSLWKNPDFVKLMNSFGDNFVATMLTPEFVVVDDLSMTAGLGSHNWLGDPSLALFSVVVIHAWQWTPFAFMALLASLAALPEGIYETARIDRTSPWLCFVRITLPLLRPAIVMVIFLQSPAQNNS